MSAMRKNGGIITTRPDGVGIGQLAAISKTRRRRAAHLLRPYFTHPVSTVRGIVEYRVIEIKAGIHYAYNHIFTRLRLRQVNTLLG